ncbi:hypothetical protein PR202_ga07772 [Eleusine coracana subsp. coracana]|uniref:Bifunctional inhibitor/plant lipid transfer protein/seed storage helical domain-containing protein n=1 Tax=Eleusine coracana subsp. coracana TaxID=191504 RepID=A0AAV5BYG4_ELECO|nr:hypothetical protein PR202_ga07772 [Eleusine coracana subsp. coracana]
MSPSDHKAGEAVVHGSCPSDALSLKVCADVLGVNAGVPRHPQHKQCCPLLEGLGDLDATVCLCTVIKAANVVSSVNIPVDLSLILNDCGKSWARNF